MTTYHCVEHKWEGFIPCPHCEADFWQSRDPEPGSYSGTHTGRWTGGRPHIKDVVKPEPRKKRRERWGFIFFCVVIIVIVFTPFVVSLFR
jgi:hypothetical protein